MFNSPKPKVTLVFVQSWNLSADCQWNIFDYTLDNVICVIVLIKYFTFPFLLWLSEENAVSKIQLQLLRPNVAVDQYGNKGHWTLIYNQGFEITVNQRVYFAFSSYAQVYWLCWCCQCTGVVNVYDVHMYYFYSVLECIWSC